MCIHIVHASYHNFIKSSYKLSDMKGSIQMSDTDIAAGIVSEGKQRESFNKLNLTKRLSQHYANDYNYLQ